MGTLRFDPTARPAGKFPRNVTLAELIAEEKERQAAATAARPSGAAIEKAERWRRCQLAVEAVLDGVAADYGLDLRSHRVDDERRTPDFCHGDARNPNALCRKDQFDNLTGRWDAAFKVDGYPDARLLVRVERGSDGSWYDGHKPFGSLVGQSLEWHETFRQALAVCVADPGERPF